jgi:hypothetical protein
VLNGIQDVMRGKFTAVYFQQVVDGIPVDKGELTLLARETEGHPLVLASSAVRFVAPVNTTPKLDADAAVEVAQKLRPDLHLDTKPELVIYPAEEETHLAWAFSVDRHSLEKPERYRVFVDAHTGALLEWRSEVYYADITGQTRGFATPGLRPDSSANPPQLRTIPKLRVSVVGGNSIFSGIDGAFTLPFSGTGSATVRAELIGTGVRVSNQAGSTLVLEQTVNSARLRRLPVQQHAQRVQHSAGERAHPHATGVRFRQVHQPELPRCGHPNPVQCEHQQHLQRLLQQPHD